MTDLEKMARYALWLSTDNIAIAEIAAGMGYQRVILDIEHGSFDLATLERFIPTLQGLGFDVTAKVLAPERGPIQQALDFGADAIAIPHIENYSHALEVCAYAKFPTLGKRSFAGGRTTSYKAPTDEWVAEQDSKTRCYPMIEDASALADIEKILSLDTVDGVFIGPSDLSLSCGRGAYKRQPSDFEDLKKIATAAINAGKDWVLPAWSDDEKSFALENGAKYFAIVTEHTVLSSGLQAAWSKTIELAKN